MQHLFTPEGEAALAAVMAARPLLAFDFDGTLAPIVARPEDARVAQRARAAARAPGAAPAARDRQRPPRRRHPRAPRVRAALRDRQPRRRGPVGGRLRAVGARRHASPAVWRRPARSRRSASAIEDKIYSIALHYRLATDHAAAFRLVDRPRRRPADRAARLRRQDGDERRARGRAEQGRRGGEPGRAVGCAQRRLRRRRPQRRTGVRGRRARVADDPDRRAPRRRRKPASTSRARTRSRCCSTGC